MPAVSPVALFVEMEDVPDRLTGNREGPVVGA